MASALAQFVATLTAAMFAGAALYINVAEHPARLLCDTRAAAMQWAPSYQRATLMQAPLAIVSCIAGIAAWLFGSSIVWLLAAVLIGGVVPVTFILIMPTNHALLAPERDRGTADTRRLLVRWGRLHGVRTVLSLLATLAYLQQLTRL
jgi:hypothetical protein